MNLPKAASCSSFSMYISPPGWDNHGGISEFIQKCLVHQVFLLPAHSHVEHGAAMIDVNSKETTDDLASDLEARQPRLFASSERPKSQLDSSRAYYQFAIIAHDFGRLSQSNLRRRYVPGQQSVARLLAKSQPEARPRTPTNIDGEALLLCMYRANDRAGTLVDRDDRNTPERSLRQLIGQLPKAVVLRDGRP